MTKKIVTFFILLVLIFTFSTGCFTDDEKKLSSKPENTLKNKKSIMSGEKKPKKSNEQPRINETLNPFGPKDIQVLKLNLDLEEKEVINILGEPNKRHKEYSDSLDGYNLFFYYSFGELVFDQLDGKYRLAIIRITKPNVYGPRNIRIGDTINSVFEKFPNENSSTENVSHKAYKKNNIDSENKLIINYDETGKISEVIYYYGDGGFGDIWLNIKVINNKIKEIELGIQNV